MVSEARLTHEMGARKHVVPAVLHVLDWLERKARRSLSYSVG